MHAMPVCAMNVHYGKPTTIVAKLINCFVLTDI